MSASPSTILAGAACEWTGSKPLLTSEVEARLPTLLDRLLPLGGPESDVMAWTGWGEPEGFGRWTVGEESRFSGSVGRTRKAKRFLDAAAIDIARGFQRRPAGGL